MQTSHYIQIIIFNANLALYLMHYIFALYFGIKL